MFTSFNAVLVNSHQPKVLQAWYEDVIGLKFSPETGTAELGGVHFGIDSHSLVHAPAAEPHRLLLSFNTDDIQRDYAALVAKDVQFVRPPEQEPWGGLIATFVDPDGNYLQMMEIPAVTHSEVLAAQHAHV
jgi:predicted enzyme related to lactoylglutathione lyase